MSKKTILFFVLILLFKAPILPGKVIPVTDKNIQAGLSACNWVRKNSYISSSVCGASLIVRFKGTSQVALQVDTDHLIFEAPGRYPIIAWTVNGGEVQTHQLAADDILILLSSGIDDPVIDLYIKGMSPMEDRFAGDLPPNSVKIEGFIVDEDGCTGKLKLPRKIWLTIGDSILSGDGAALAKDQGRPADDLWSASDDSRASYGYLLAKHFGYRESRLAFGGYDWGGGMAGVPSVKVLVDSITSTVGRLTHNELNPVPDVVLINLGENGAPSDQEVILALAKIRIRTGTDCKIIVMIPVSGRAKKEVSRAFNFYVKSTGDKNAYLVDLGSVSFDTCDGQHPVASGHQSIYRAAIQPITLILK
jgi:hypothetical protein